MAKKAKASSKKSRKTSRKTTRKTTRKTAKKTTKKLKVVTKKINLKDLYIPIAIVIAGVLIACSIVFVSGSSNSSFSLPFLASENLECDREEDALSQDCLKQYAKDIGLKYSKFKSCLEDEKYDSVIDEELAYAQEIGARGTPHVIIGEGTGDTFRGFYAGGAQGYDYYKKIIEDVKNLGLEEANKKLIEDTLGSREELEKLYREAYEKQGYSGEQLDEIVKAGVDSEFANLEIKEYKVGNGIVTGNKDAKLVLMEFSEFECPYCKQFAQKTFPDLDKNYIQTGELRYIFRDFPLESIHKKARRAANAGRCANEQGKFIEYHDAVFGINEAE